jgi:hypothetical protein
VADERSNDALDVWAAFYIGLKVKRLIVSASRVDRGTIIADKDLAHRFGAGFLRAALCPQRTVATLLSQETKDAPVAAARTIREGGGSTVGAWVELPAHCPLAFHPSLLDGKSRQKDKAKRWVVVAI